MLSKHKWEVDRLEINSANSVLEVSVHNDILKLCTQYWRTFEVLENLQHKLRSNCPINTSFEKCNLSSCEVREIFLILREVKMDTFSLGSHEVSSSTFET